MCTIHGILEDSSGSSWSLQLLGTLELAGLQCILQKLLWTSGADYAASCTVDEPLPALTCEATAIMAGGSRESDQPTKMPPCRAEKVTLGIRDPTGKGRLINLLGVTAEKCC